MTFTEHKFLSFDETPIFYRRHAARPDARGAVIILHGMGEHGGRYEETAGYLGELGLQCYMPDLRGFGKSGGKRACVKAFSDYQKDVFALHSFVLKDCKNLPVFLLGHSLGGLIAASYCALPDHERVRPKGLVLSSPNFGIALSVPRWRECLGLLCSYLAPDYTQPNQVKPDHLTHDKAILAEYQRDPLIIHLISARLYREMMRAISSQRLIAEHISIPTLILQAGGDLVVSRKSTENFYQLLDSEDKELEIFEGFYHEILNETDRVRVFSRIGQWIMGHLVP